ncbi:MAG: YggS family pyridoxal phosphate-dependent enzyme [Actinobacteria bacterium]|nr:YggS family pyridoxal phosphate-dependent enzyme [Acidobacteriota bacterium]MBS1195558.1 YggS family pyridoxal phosphate-dependent enzyme [Actinomycetota bacterium]
MAGLRLDEVRERLAAAAARAGRDAAGITLVAVSKGASPEMLREAYAAGQRDFGENRAGALAERAGQLPGEARWHFIGRLQGNKVRLVRPVACLLHSLDRPELAGHWVKGPGLPPPALVQVNVSGDPAKAGVAPGEAEALVAAAAGLGIPVRGLMTIPPVGANPEEARPWFRALAGLQRSLLPRWPGLADLSMGMSDDFEVAVEEGATLLRVGRAIFGPFPRSGERG